MITMVQSPEAGVGRRGQTILVQVLQAGRFLLQLDHRVNAAYCSLRRRKRRYAGNVIANRGASNGFFVVERFTAQRRVEHQIDLARLDQVDDVRPPLVHLKYLIARHPGSVERGSSPARGHQLETERYEFLPKRCDMPLVTIVDADEHGARLRQFLSRGELRLGERQPKDVEMPITSPVERISGPRMVSTPRNLLNGNTGDFTE